MVPFTRLASAAGRRRKTIRPAQAIDRLIGRPAHRL